MFWGCGQCTSSPGFCLSGHPENIAVTTKAAACQMFIPRKWTESHGETRSREWGSFSANKLEALCWVPWLHAQSRKSPCCFLVFNLNKKPVCENMSPLDVYRNLVAGSPWGQIFKPFFWETLKWKRLPLHQTCSITEHAEILSSVGSRSTLKTLFFVFVIVVSDAWGHLEVATTRWNTFGRTFLVWVLWSLELYCLVSHGLCGKKKKRMKGPTKLCTALRKCKA